VAGVTAVAMMAAFHFGGFLHELTALAQSDPSLRTRDFLDPASFARHMDKQARVGIALSRAGHPEDGFNLRDAGSYAYWLAEIAFAGYVIFALVRAAADAPLCERCRRWKTERPLIVLPPADREAVRTRLREGQLLTLLTEGPDDGSERLALQA